MNNNGDPGPARRFAQGCLYDDWFDGTSLSFEPGFARGIGTPRRQ